MLNLKLVLKPLVLAAVMVAVFIAVFEFPAMQRMYVRHNVAERVFEIKGKPNGGGGTGFQVEAPSGDTYIVTNSHICEFASKDSGDANFLLVRKGEHWMKRRILEVSGESDLCLVEAWPSLSGLKLGDSVRVGEMVSAVGHPHLGPTTMSSGEVVAWTDTEIPHHIMPTGDAKLDKLLRVSDEPCNQPKNAIVKKMMYFMGFIPLGEAPICIVKEHKAIQTNVVIFGGNSGSPLVDSWGNVVGVVFASDTGTNWGFAVNLKHLKLLLKDF